MLRSCFGAGGPGYGSVRLKHARAGSTDQYSEVRIAALGIAIGFLTVTDNPVRSNLKKKRSFIPVE